MKVTDFDLKTLALANRNSANSLINLQRADNANRARAKLNLTAAIGGVLGLGAGYLLSMTFQLPLGVCSFLGCAAMLALTLALCHVRGRGSFEKRLEENKAAMQEVLARIRALPKNAPAEVRDELWQIYRALNVELPGNKLSRDSLLNSASSANTSNASFTQNISGPNLNVPLTPAANAPHVVKPQAASASGAPPLTPEQKHAANMALKKALERVEDHALSIAQENAEQQSSIEARLQTRQPMEWKQEKRQAAPETQDHAWLEDAGETVFATTGEVFQANQKTVRSVVFPRVSKVGG